MKVTVVLAAFHGEAFLKEQINSILPQLCEEDELIVSDDAPGGATQRIVMEYCGLDSRIQYIEGPGQGVCANFAHALIRGTGDVFFLCDQDDVWLPDKRALVLREFEKGASLVLHDAIVTDAALHPLQQSFFAQNGQRGGLLQTFLHNRYIGCCMAFTRALRDLALPFPRKLPMHDWWIGLLAEAQRSCTIHIIPLPLLYYRRHEQTVTGGRTPLLRKLLWRGRLLPQLAARLYLPKREINAIL